MKIFPAEYEGEKMNEKDPTCFSIRVSSRCNILNYSSFTDVPVDRREAVQFLYSNKYVNGVSADKFGWKMPIKHVDAALIIAVLKKVLRLR
jgi:hypothetical protein